MYAKTQAAANSKGESCSTNFLTLTQLG